MNGKLFWVQDNDRIMTIDTQKLESDISSKIIEFWNGNPVSTGIALIDLQHIWLLQIIFRLELILDSHDHDAIKETVNKSFLDVIDYAGEHFSMEEEIMEHFNYPRFDDHVKNHRDFAEKLKEKFENFGEDEIVAHGLLSVLKKWLVNHILKDDRDYSDYFKSTSAKVKSYCEMILGTKKYTVTKVQINLYNQVIKSKTVDIKEVIAEDTVSQIRNIWKSYNLAIHIPMVDLQHIWLLKMIVELDRAVKVKTDKDRGDVLKSVIQGALEYTEEHFDNEERLMKQFRFTDLINHSNQHKRFVQFIKTRAEEEQLGNPQAAEHLILDLKNWLLSHIAFEDRKIGNLLNGKSKEVSEFTKKIHENGYLKIKPEHKALYKEVMKH